MVEFALHTLGWKAFQDLSATILREVLGQSLQVYNAGKDGGRDAAYFGTWMPRGRDSLSGKFTVQCKFFPPLSGYSDPPI